MASRAIGKLPGISSRAGIIAGYLSGKTVGRQSEMKCETLFYVELEERLCGKPAVALLDGTSPRCADCAERCHPSRLTEIVPPKAAADGAAGTVRRRDEKENII